MASNPMPMSEQAPGGAASSTMTPQVIQQLIAALKASQGQVGAQTGAPPPVTPGMVGQAGGTPMPSVAGPYNPSGAAPAIAPPSPGRSTAPQIPMPNQNVEYGSPAGARAGTIQNAVGGIVQLVNQQKQRKQEQTSLKAENDFSQLMTALQNGDQKTVQLITGDEKTMKGIEKGLDYYFPKEQDQGPKKPPPPEAHGISSAVSKLKNKITGQNQSPQSNTGQRVMPSPGPAQQLQAALLNARVNAAKQDPNALAQMAGLTASPDVAAKITSDQQIESFKAFTEATKTLQDNQTKLQVADRDYQGKIDSETASANIHAAAEVQAAQIRANAELKKALIGRKSQVPGVDELKQFTAMQNASSQLKAVMAGGANSNSIKALQMSLQQAGLSSIAKNLPTMILGMKFGGADWKTLQSSLDDAVRTTGSAIQEKYPGWKNPSGAAANAPSSDVITVTPDDMK